MKYLLIESNLLLTVTLNNDDAIDKYAILKARRKLFQNG